MGLGKSSALICSIFLLDKNRNSCDIPIIYLTNYVWQMNEVYFL
jgi:hypothetical protein